MLCGVPRSAMDEAVTEMRRSAETGDVPLMGTSSSAFHRLVVEASENRLLIRAWEALQIEARTSIALMILESDLATVAGPKRYTDAVPSPQ
jgi:DNA-binding GntR family transcriptional regulator